MAASGGLSAVTIRSIAAERGLTTGAVMHHFPTKEAILEEMIDRLYSGLVDVVTLALARAKPHDRLQRRLLACLPLKPDLVFGWRLSVVLQGEVLRSPAIAALHNAYYRRFEEGLAAELSLAIGAGWISKNTDIPATTARLISLVEGVGTNHVLRPKSMPARLQRQLILDEIARLKA